MSPSAKKPVVAIIDSKSLRRASISSFLEPWANSEDLRLKAFGLDQAREALHEATSFRMVILSLGGESIAEREILQQLNVLRALASRVPLVAISDREDAQEIAAAFNAEAKGFIPSGIDAELARGALTFILHGGAYFPPSAVHQLRTQLEQAHKPPGGPTDGSASDHHGHAATGKRAAHSIEDQVVNLTVRQHQVLKHVRLGESNKAIARELGMVEATVKVHVRQLMRKFCASNRTQLALGQSLAAEHRSAADDNAERSVEQDGGTFFAPKRATHREPTLRLIARSVRGRRRDD